MRFRPYLSLLILAQLAGCPASSLVVTPGPAVAGRAVDPAVQTADTAPPIPAAKPTTTTFAGTVSYFGAPLAGAEVVVRVLGDIPALASVKTGADGSFQCSFDTPFAPGTLLEFLATGSGHRVGTVALVAEAPRALHVLADNPGQHVVLDELQTAALIILAPRLLAVMATGSTTAATVAFATFAAAALALGGQGTPLARTSFDGAVASLIDDVGRIRQGESTRAAATALVPAGKVDALVRAADQLADTIRTAVAAGGKLPDTALDAALAIGPQTAVAVFAAGSGDAVAGASSAGSGGSAGGSFSGGSSDAGGSGSSTGAGPVTAGAPGPSITDGAVVDTAASATIMLGP